MKTTALKALTLLLAFCLLTGCGRKADEAAEVMALSVTPAPEATASPAPTATSAPTDTPAPTAAPETPTPGPTAVPTRAPDGFYFGDEHADVQYEDMHWLIRDMTQFRETADKLSQAATPEEARELYDWLVREYVRLRTDRELAWIDFYAAGGSDEALSAACQSLDDMLVEAGDLLFAAASDAMAGENNGAFSDYLGPELTEDLTDYEKLTDRETELHARETELELQYEELADRSDLSAASLNRKLGAIFLELVRVRNELAQIKGYDTYAQYAYENIYVRDYTPEDAAALCQTLKPLARRYYRDCYYSSIFWEQPGVFSADDLMGILRRYAPLVSPRAAEAQQYVENHGLYLFKSSRVVSKVCFTTTLAWYNAPFQFNALYGGAYDVTSVFHEFGHCYDAYINPEPGPLTANGSFDVFEIHSTGMEALSIAWYDEIFGAEADVARAHAIDGLIGNVVSGCLYDEFLQYCYAHPDMTVDELNQAYYDIASSYGMRLPSASSRYNWMYVNHNFTSPFYYISYAASSLASLQILSLSGRDRTAAVELYNRLVEIGAYDKPYQEVVHEAGLKSLTEDVGDCVEEAIDDLERLCTEYEHGKRAA